MEFSFTLKPKSESFKFGEEQIQALNRLEEFITSTETCITLTGAAGTGKTSLVREILEYMDDEEISYTLAAPTHKAKLVVEALSGEEAKTVHQLLALSPNIEIFELDYRDLVFETSKSPIANEGIPYKGVVIVDEASMINDNLFQLLIDKCQKRRAKVIFVGDVAQLAPVKDEDISQVFSLPNCITLTKVYRQKDDSPVLDILGALRNTPAYSFSTRKGVRDSFITYTSSKDWILAAQPILKETVEQGNVLNCKLLAYTNARVRGLNEAARKVIFGSDSSNEYNAKEILVGKDNFEYDGYKFYNSLDYIITSEPSLCTVSLPYFGEPVKGYYLDLYDSIYKGTHTVFIISRENNLDTLSNLSSLIENTRLTALRAKKKTKAASTAWQRYYQIINSFASPFDLYYDNRVIKKKTFDYGYASTVHVSQGSSYNTVFVDMGNIWKQQKVEDLRQLQYVSISRTRGDVHVLI